PSVSRPPGFLITLEPRQKEPSLAFFPEQHRGALSRPLARAVRKQSLRGKTEPPPAPLGAAKAGDQSGPESPAFCVRRSASPPAALQCRAITQSGAGPKVPRLSPFQNRETVDPDRASPSSRA